MQWNSTYNIGVDHIDKQHKIIFKLVNDLHDAIGKLDTDELVGRTLIELVNYSKVHFADEEKYMREIGYPNLNNQINMHKQLNEEIVLMLKKLRRNDPLSIRQIYAFLQNWLVEHIKVEDKKIGTFVKVKKTNEPVGK